MDVSQALEIVKKYNKEEFHIHHAKVVSGVMQQFAREYDPGNEQYWAVVGMLHDVDFELYPEQHCVKCRELLKNEGVSEDIIRSVVSHGYGLCQNDIAPEQTMEKVLFAADELTGLIGAAALMRPSKSVSDMEVSSVKKKFKDKKFAAGCSREVILRGADMLGLTIDELMAKTLAAMKEIEE